MALVVGVWTTYRDMDAFSLLARSTRLKKSALIQPEPVSNASVDRAAKESKKRKRDAEPQNAAAQPTEQESRDILKEHKLKVSPLWTQQQDNHEPSRKRSKKGSVDETPLKKQKLDIIPQPLQTFDQLRSRYDLPDSLLRNIEEQGFKKPTEVQMGSLPLLLDSASYSQLLRDRPTKIPACNLMSIAPTGSGKTLAFLIPLIASILSKRKSEGELSSTGPLAVVIAPTKELARQIVNESRKLCSRTGIRTTLVRKGVSLYGQQGAADDRSDDEKSSDDDNGKTAKVKSQILVSTPLALVHATCPPSSDQPCLPSVENLVLDEADVLLDPLFREQTMRVWNGCTNAALRVSLWSATVGSSIEELAVARVKQVHASESAAPLLRLVVGLKDSSIPNIDHRLIYAASEQGKLMGMRQLLHSPEKSESGAILRPPFLVFTQTIPRAIALHSELLFDIPAEAGGSSRIAVLHSDLSETARDKVMTRLRKGEIWVLITTDLLARGIDFHGINGVVNYDMPTSSAAYVHRAGRTGRAGRKGGVAVTLYSKDDLPFVKNIANVIAASERQGHEGGAEEARRKWLLEALPKVTKKDKQRLKQRGVESRRPTSFKSTEKGSKDTKSQISTRGGFLRRMENNRKGAIEGSKKRKVTEAACSAGPENDSFAGFE